MINVVVTCTKRKKAVVPDRLKFRRLPKAPVETKVQLWLERLRSIPAEPTPARDLYSGDHWSIARSLENLRTYDNSSIRVWVASAGYGVLSLDDRIKPYSATFSSTHPDSISQKTTSADRRSVFRDWWRLMAKWSGPHRGNPRTIAAIARKTPDAPLIVVASENYLAAIEDDLRIALEELSDPDLLSIVSGGTKSLDGLNGHLVPCDARLQAVVGGALRSLNIRVARKVISQSRESPITLPVLQKKLSGLLRKQPELKRFERRPMSDSAVRAFIKGELQANSAACHSPLLRKLRDAGKACEQSRFAALYREVKERRNGT
jgi:hypothetical protein